MINIQALMLLVVVIGSVHATNDFEKLRQIWRLQQAFKSCDNTLNYGCSCTAASAKDLTCDFKCISLERRCDGKIDCPLGDDERGCPLARCKKGSICCTNGSCATLCDGVPECPHNADEEQCEPPVPTQCPGRMQCPNGNCATVCDGDLDCEDDVGCDLDEKDCRYVCPANCYICEDDGTCSAICNGINECTSGADESTCYLECNEDEVSCELEGTSERECVELCEDSNGACENEFDDDDIYCGTCTVCGETTDASCEKVVGTCGI